MWTIDSASICRDARYKDNSSESLLPHRSHQRLCNNERRTQVCIQCCFEIFQTRISNYKPNPHEDGTRCRWFVLQLLHSRWRYPLFRIRPGPPWQVCHTLPQLTNRLGGPWLWASDCISATRQKVSAQPPSIENSAMQLLSKGEKQDLDKLLRQYYF